MSEHRPYARISITLPEADLAEADRLAQRADRSRSWIVAEALRRYVEAQPDGPDGTANPASPRLFPGAATVSRGLGDSRLAQLERDLALTAEQRVREAEQTLRLSELIAGDAPSPGPRGFDRYEDFLDWQQFGRLVEP